MKWCAVLILSVIVSFGQLPTLPGGGIGWYQANTPTTPFTPLSLSPSLWYDATTVNGVNGLVTNVWKDLSANGWDAYQENLTSKPIWTNSSFLKTNSLFSPDGLRFMTNTTALGVMNGIGGMTIATICVPYAGAPVDVATVAFFSRNGSASSTKGALAVSTIATGNGGLEMEGRRVEADAFTTLYDGVISSNTPIRIVATFDYANAQWTLYSNNVQVAQAAKLTAGNTAASDSAAFRLLWDTTSGSGFRGLIGEILVVRRVINSGERSSLDSYWTTKWIP